MLPQEFPPKSTVQSYFYAWRADGTLRRVHHRSPRRRPPPPSRTATGPPPLLASVARRFPVCAMSSPTHDVQLPNSHV